MKDYFAFITSLLTPSLALLSRQEFKKKSFADDRLNVIPAGEADICGNAVCLSKIVENDQTNCIYIGRRCEVLATQGPAE